MNHRNLFLVMLLVALMSSCGGNKILKEPQVLELKGPLVVASDSRLVVALDWVIVRDGPGTWSKNAHWDEYLFRIRNLSSKDVTIESIVVFDSMETGVNSNSNRKQLIEESNLASKRYHNEGFIVKEGLGGAQLAAVGGATAAVGTGLVLASSTLGPTLLAGTVGVVVAPVIVAGGVLRGVNNSKVSKEIEKRSSEMPFTLTAGSEVAVHAFYPMSPSPVRVEVNYLHDGADSLLIIDTMDTLRGLHLAVPEQEDDAD